tara:strand:- start:348 stop:617 length:270 start_codon:yes stop_codon:yes gene_type:complete
MKTRDNEVLKWPRKPIRTLDNKYLRIGDDVKIRIPPTKGNYKPCWVYGEVLGATNKRIKVAYDVGGEKRIAYMNWTAIRSTSYRRKTCS